MNLDLFEKCDVQPSRKTAEPNCVTITKSDNSIKISPDVVVKAGWKEGDRVDLYRMGKTFALNKSKVGILTLRRINGTKGLRIGNQSAYLEIAAHTHTNKFTAWVEEGVIFFKPREEV